MYEFIRKTVHTIKQKSRNASTEHGNLVPFQPMSSRVTTAVAKWAHKILTDSGETQSLPKYSPLWNREMHIIAIDSKFACFDHLMVSDYNVSYRVKKPFQRLTNEAVKAYIRLGYRRTITSTWEDVADMPIFDNIHVINPSTTEPWRRPDIELDAMFANKKKYKDFKFLYHLTNFDVSAYRASEGAEVPSLQMLTADELYSKYDHRRDDNEAARAESTHRWESLLNSISPEWTRALTAGNTKRAPNEFFAMSQGGDANPNEIKVVLRWDGQNLHTYNGNLNGHSAVLKQSRYSAPPGANYGPGERFKMPQFCNLRRVRVKLLKDQEIRVAGYMLPNYSDWKPFDDGIQIGQYTKEGKTFRNVTREWRNSVTPRPQLIKEFSTKVFGDAELNLSKLMGVINKLLVNENIRDMLQKIIHSGLYCGQVARDYQIRVKGVTPQNAANWANLGHTLTPEFCPYLAHTYTRPMIQGIANGPEKPVEQVVPNYDYIFWESPMAAAVWQVVVRALRDMEIECPVDQHWHDIFRNLQNQHDKEFTTEFYIKSATVLTGLWILYQNYKRLTEEYLMARTEDKQLPDLVVHSWLSQIKREIHESLGNLGFCLPVMQNEAKKRATCLVDGRKTPCYGQRERALWPPTVITTKLTNQSRELYDKYWLKTSILEIRENDVLHTKPFHSHDYPP